MYKIILLTITNKHNKLYRMIDFLFVFVIVLIGVLITHTVNKIMNNLDDIKKPEEVKVKCPPHQWVIDDTSNVMFCLKCGYKLTKM